MNFDSKFWLKKSDQVPFCPYFGIKSLFYPYVGIKSLFYPYVGIKSLIYPYFGIKFLFIPILVSSPFLPLFGIKSLFYPYFGIKSPFYLYFGIKSLFTSIGVKKGLDLKNLIKFGKKSKKKFANLKTIVQYLLTTKTVSKHTLDLAT
ncbi:hypothetical protein CDIK_3067 [Cucumispora dikerogammari]|nr:hypothetical protein CDIK_3067 [Cucumispora dikerogammari]